MEVGSWSSLICDLENFTLADQNKRERYPGSVQNCRVARLNAKKYLVRSHVSQHKYVFNARDTSRVRVRVVYKHWPESFVFRSGSELVSSFLELVDSAVCSIFANLWMEAEASLSTVQIPLLVGKW